VTTESDIRHSKEQSFEVQFPGFPPIALFHIFVYVIIHGKRDRIAGVNTKEHLSQHIEEKCLPSGIFSMIQRGLVAIFEREEKNSGSGSRGKRKIA
jgi:hypothetical protein